MKQFACTYCGNKTYLTNVSCVQCGHRLGFDADMLTIVAIGHEGAGIGPFRQVGKNDGARFYYCANAVHGVCNWLVPEGGPSGFCIACQLNDTIPDLTGPGNLQSWNELEQAKKRLIYSLLRFGLPLDATHLGKEGLKFKFVADKLTGHLDGIITINIAETDAVERERQRQNFDELYRTLLGHLRHESGHFYWAVLVEETDQLEAFRALFGDENQDYAKSLERHHANGPADGWQLNYVSAYASTHPWEDWAETWAHYVHMVDAVETAEMEGIEPRAANLDSEPVRPVRYSGTYDVYRDGTFDDLKQRWVPLTIALNRLSRSLGHNDFYPFVTPVAAYEKLAFVHRLIRQYRERAGI
jgi:hypothetical protein